MRVFCVLLPGAAARPLAVRAASFARRVVSKPAPRATRLPSAALRAARSASAPRAACSPSVELVFSCLSACWRPGAAARPLAVRAASFARRVVSKPAPRATRLPSAALRAARSASAPRAACSPSVELVFSCLSACWRPGAAARPLAVRAASFARRVVSKPGQALPPPPGTRANTGVWLLVLSPPGADRA